jgi:hypothetical protein
MTLTSDEGEFIAAVRRMAGAPGSPAAAESAQPADQKLARAAAARAFAAQHSWTRRADAFAAAIGLRAAQPSDHDGPPVLV